MNPTLVLALDSAVPAAGLAQPRPNFRQCLLLAALLHLWLVALIGTSPGGSARPGDGVWSAIQVRLAGPGPLDSPGRADLPLPHGGAVGRSPEPRFGGTVRDAPAQPSPEPGAARLGAWATRPEPGPSAGAALPAQPMVAPPVATPPPVLTRTRPLAPQRPEDPAAAPAVAPAAPDPPPQPAADARPAPSTAPRLAPVDTVEAPVLQRPLQALSDIANPAPLPTAVARPQPTPAPQREDRAATSVATQAPPPPRPALPIDVSAPVLAPVPLTPPPAVEPPSSPTAVAPPAVVSAPPAASPPPLPEPLRAVDPPPQPAAPQPPAPTVAPPLRPLAPVVPLGPVDVAPAQRLGAPDLSVPPVRAVDPALPGAPVAAPVRDSAGPVTAPPASAVKPAGQPEAGPRLGPDRAAGTPAAASAPRLNLELPRARAALPGLVSPRVLNLVPPPPERKSALSEGIEKAAKADCRKAYGGMGPLAILPLAVDALRDGGCRW